MNGIAKSDSVWMIGSEGDPAKPPRPDRAAKTYLSSADSSDFSAALSDTGKHPATSPLWQRQITWFDGVGHLLSGLCREFAEIEAKWDTPKPKEINHSLPAQLEKLAVEKGQAAVWALLDEQSYDNIDHLRANEGFVSKKLTCQFSLRLLVACVR